MTNQLTLRSLDIPSITKFGIGFDNMFDDLLRTTTQNSQNYPPYNIIKYDEDHFAIELAVAGFNEGDVSVMVEKNVLSVKGEQVQDLDKGNETITYLHHGISSRNFVRHFTLAEHVEVTEATVANGILRINLERKIPEEQKPKTFLITFNNYIRDFVLAGNGARKHDLKETLMPNTETTNKIKPNLSLKEPPLFKVIYFNDDRTSMEFVVYTLIEYFNYTEETAATITLDIHEGGSAVVAVLPYEIAEQKGIEVTVKAREQGYPLQVKVESE